MISIIIPAYNEERYLERCLKSILSQGQEGYEIILVDDGSTDATGEIGRHLAENCPVLHYLYQQRSGQGTARDTGVKAAGGDWLVFVDADDELLPGSLKTMKKLTGTDADIIWYEHILCNDTFVRRQRIRVEEETVTREQMSEVTTFLWDKMFNREFWLREADALENCYGEDLITVYWLLARSASTLILREALYRHYDQQEMNHMSHRPECLKEITVSLAKLLDKFRKEGMWEDYCLSLLVVCHSQLYLYTKVLTSRYSSETSREIEWEFQDLFDTHFPDEMAMLKELGKHNLVTIGGTDKKYQLGTLGIGYERYHDMEVFLLSKQIMYNRIFLIDISVEDRNVRCGTRTPTRFLEDWESRCRELGSVTGGKGNHIFLSRNQERTEDYMAAMLEIFMRYIPEAVELMPWDSVLSLPGTGMDIGSHEEYWDKDRTPTADLFRGESYRHGYQEDILHLWLKLKLGKGNICTYFEKRQITSIAIYGLGYLGERLADELEGTSVEVLYGIDRSRTESWRGLEIYSPEGTLPETELIVVTVVHLYNEAEWSLKQVTSIPVISLEEVLFRCLK